MGTAGMQNGLEDAVDSEGVWEGYLTSGTRIVKDEAAALQALSGVLDTSFCRAVDLLVATRGRVVVSGMGKSGHMCRKIAATFASTGQPAQFVHPAEASHGDLGMLVDGDSAILVSNSGETPELADIMAYSRRYAIPSIGITGKPDSELARMVDVAIVLPPIKEACPAGIVPTSSAVMTLALGDALALTLMEHRGFTPGRFRMLHPGGSLGAQLTSVNDIMHTGDALPIVSPETRMPDALLVMTNKGFGVAGVVEDERLVGIVTDGDLRRHMDCLLDKSVRHVMTGSPLFITPGILVQEALAVMNTQKITCLPVVADEQTRQWVGILHVHDCLRAGIS